MYKIMIKSPLGPLIALSDEQALHGLCFLDIFKGDASHPTNADHPILKQTQQWIEAYFERAAAPKPNLVYQGTPFMLAVWQAMDLIKLGQTQTYGALAKAVGRPLAVRAVGGIVGRNPFDIMQPCHRVVGSQSLTGYQGGLERKKWLLDFEGAHPFTPTRISSSQASVSQR